MSDLENIKALYLENIELKKQIESDKNTIDTAFKTLSNREETSKNLLETYMAGFEAGKNSGLQWLPIETAPKDGTEIIIAIMKPMQRS